MHMHIHTDNRLSHCKPVYGVPHPLLATFDEVNLPDELFLRVVVHQVNGLPFLPAKK